MFSTSIIKSRTSPLGQQIYYSFHSLYLIVNSCKSSSVQLLVEPEGLKISNSSISVNIKSDVASTL